MDGLFAYLAKSEIKGRVWQGSCLQGSGRKEDAANF